MNLAIARIKQIIPHFNERPLTEADFWKICRRENIQVIETPLLVDGFCFETGAKKFIYLNSRLRGIFWLQAAFHELGHIFLHTPPGSERFEQEAQAIALMAILPLGNLEKAVAETDEFSEIAGEILRERLQILAKHGF
jgi:Zn-dependent peptidase ImmA (M78 family)